MTAIEKVREAWKVILENNHAYRPSAYGPDRCECGIELVHRVHVQIVTPPTEPQGEMK